MRNIKLASHHDCPADYRPVTYLYRIYDPDPLVAELEEDMFQNAKDQLDGTDSISLETISGKYLATHKDRWKDPKAE